PFRYVRVGPSALPAYQTFLRARYKDDIAGFNGKYGTHLTSFGQAALADSDAVPAAGPPLLDWLAFLGAAPAAALAADTPETRWGGPLGPSAQQADWAYVQANAGPLRWDFLGRNYRLVTQYMVLHGRAVFNTFVYCALAILTTLIVNPLCAYALSRYSLSYGNSVLLFLLATMAFPGEVTMIPNFLLLKNLHLLNTFAALILPGVASGFSIFLLKGFFDSLPKELYEAGTLDGASEARMFWDITLPLCKPIFAVIGLGAFTAAFTNFLMAMVICQDPKIWTLMVWIYELGSSGAPQYVMMAAATLATVPTLLVFLLAQNTIMKGIILPSYK
ncbi:MAG: carbohydrate ABC transporter permease, partial [Armatimonadetes bacterium]|nr:carbohydrate ABC transporter permease [Armatimonadota bacterium]